MIRSNNWQRNITDLLNEIGTDACLNKAKELQSGHSNSGLLHLRQLGLEKEHISSICQIFADENKSISLDSISFSYNPKITDEGAITIIKNLPKTIKEIGIVACGISDMAGKEILEHLRDFPDLKMICIEDNTFSDKLKKEFLDYKKNQSGLVVFV